ncbi:DNA translocase FtsK, partial [Klebsiella pneumoniae]
ADAPIIGTGALKTSQPAGDEEAASAGAFPPPLDLLGPSSPGVSASENSAALDQGSDVIEALSNFGVEATLAHTIVGPTVIQY